MFQLKYKYEGNFHQSNYKSDLTYLKSTSEFNDTWHTATLNNDFLAIALPKLNPRELRSDIYLAADHLESLLKYLKNNPEITTNNDEQNFLDLFKFIGTCSKGISHCDSFILYKCISIKLI